MKQWAKGMFDSDAAMDFVGQLVDRMVAEIEGVVADPSRLEPDEYYGQVLPCIVAILADLYELSGTSALPEPAVVADWKARYLAVWESHTRADLRRRKERRVALATVFDRLEGASRQAHAD